MSGSRLLPPHHRAVFHATTRNRGALDAHPGPVTAKKLVSNRRSAPAATSPATSKGGGPAQRASAQRAEAARARLAEQQRRRRLITVGSSVAAVIAVLAVLVVVRVATGSGGAKSGQQATAADTSVLGRVTAVPAAVLDQVGAGTISTPPSALSAPALTAGGKPRVLYVGAEYCPYCAAERWPVTVALSRFGTFTGLGQTASSPSDVYPSTATLSFHGATYTSSYLAFTGKELESNQVRGDRYAPLDTLDTADQKRVGTYNKGGGIPFVDVGGKYSISGASYNPGVLKGLTHAQIAADLSQPTTAVGRAVDGTANVITAALCQLTGKKPAAVCSSAGVTAAAVKLPHA